MMKDEVDRPIKSENDVDGECGVCNKNSNQGRDLHERRHTKPFCQYLHFEEDIITCALF